MDSELTSAFKAVMNETSAHPGFAGEWSETQSIAPNSSSFFVDFFGGMGMFFKWNQCDVIAKLRFNSEMQDWEPLYV